jgi:hypothetical protein
MALASDGSLFTWGDGSRGQLGHGHLQQVASIMPADAPLHMVTPQKIARLDPNALSPENRCEAALLSGGCSGGNGRDVGAGQMF